MPRVLEECVSTLMAKWQKDPKSRPAPRQKDQKPREQAFAICTATLKKAGKMTDTEYATALLEAGDGDMAGRIAMLEDLGHDHDQAIKLAVADREAGKPKVAGLGPALLGVALTIRPFIKRQEMASVLEDGEKATMRIPVMRRGAWRHPLYGVLKFDDEFFNRIQMNFDSKSVGQELPVKETHKPDQGALGWISKIELTDKGQFIVYAPANDERGPKLIKTKTMPYASAEFVFDYKGTEMKMLSFEDLEEVKDESDGVYSFSDEELEFISNYGCGCSLEEDNMPGDGETTNDVVQLTAEQLEEMRGQLAQLAEMRETVTSLQTALTERDTQIAAERERIAELENINEAALAAAILERARGYRDEEGRTHSALFLSVLEAGLTLGSLTFGEETVIEMSEEISAETVREYYTGLLRYLAENQPGVVPTEGHTEGVDDRALDGSKETNLEEIGGDLWNDEASGF